MFLSPQQVLRYGLEFHKVKTHRWSQKSKVTEFHKLYGSSPLDLADQWYDLCYGEYLDNKIALQEKEKNEKGFRRFMMTHYWMWEYPKNARIFSKDSGICERYCRGKPHWIWLERIGALKVKKIVWPKNKPDEFIPFSVDGVDFIINEEPHPTLERDPGGMSHKIKHYAAKYEVVLATQQSKCIHIAGPFKGAVHDLTMFRRSGLKEKLQKWNAKVGDNIRHVCLCLADRGYITSRNDEDVFAIPNGHDEPETASFKSRGRLRHETFNARLKFFSCLRCQWHHGFKKHGLAFEAVCVTVQYQMDNGSPIFSA